MLSLGLSTKPIISNFQFDLESEGHRFVSRKTVNDTLVRQTHYSTIKLTAKTCFEIHMICGSSLGRKSSRFKLESHLWKILLLLLLFTFAFFLLCLLFFINFVSEKPAPVEDDSSSDEEPLAKKTKRPEAPTVRSTLVLLRPYYMYLHNNNQTVLCFCNSCPLAIRVKPSEALSSLAD